MRIERVQRAGHNLKIWKVASDHALDPMPCSLARCARSIRIQQDGAWKGIGRVIIEKLVSVRAADSLKTI